MEIVNGVLKKAVNFSILEVSIFFFLGIGFYYLFQQPKFLSFLDFIFHQHDIDRFPLILFFILSWSLLFLIIKKILVALYKFALSFRKYDFNSLDWPDRWEYQGNVRIWESEKNALYVTDSNSGCILKNHFWKNFEMNFKCKFPNGNDYMILGIIFRAKKLSDYLMVQIHNKDDKKQINPHIRMEGVWELVEGGPKLNIELEKNIFYDVHLRVFNQRVELFINDDKQLDWFLPTNSDIALKEHEAKTDRENAIVPKIDFRKKYGRVGFRAYGNEGAIIKDLSIKRLSRLV